MSTSTVAADADAWPPFCYIISFWYFLHKVRSRGSGSTSATTLTQHQKFQKAKKVFDKLPSLASEVGMKDFMKQMDPLQKIHDVWAHGGNVIVLDEDDLC